MMETNVVQEVVVLDQLVETVLLHIVQLLDQVEVGVHHLLLVLLWVTAAVESEVVVSRLEPQRMVVVQVLLTLMLPLALTAQVAVAVVLDATLEVRTLAVMVATVLLLLGGVYE
jgi:hypothetical protein